MAGNRRHTGGMRSAMQNLKKYDAVHDLSADERRCALCQVDPVEAQRLSMPLHADWCPNASPEKAAASQRPASFGDCDECIGGCEKCMPSEKTSSPHSEAWTCQKCQQLNSAGTSTCGRCEDV